MERTFEVVAETRQQCCQTRGVRSFLVARHSVEIMFRREARKLTYPGFISFRERVDDAGEGLWDGRPGWLVAIQLRIVDWAGPQSAWRPGRLVRVSSCDNWVPQRQGAITSWRDGNPWFETHMLLRTATASAGPPRDPNLGLLAAW